MVKTYVKRYPKRVLAVSWDGTNHAEIEEFLKHAIGFKGLLLTLRNDKPVLLVSSSVGPTTIVTKGEYVILKPNGMITFATARKMDEVYTEVK